MPRLTGIPYRKLIGLVPKSRLTKAQKKEIEDKNIPPDTIEYYFGRRCEYWKISNLN